MDAFQGEALHLKMVIANAVDSLSVHAFESLTVQQVLIDQQARKYEELLKEHQSLKEAHANVLNVMLEKDATIKGLEGKLQSLEDQVKSLQEENMTFQKVSSIIQYDKENKRLRQEIATLEKKLLSGAVPPKAGDLRNMDAPKLGAPKLVDVPIQMVQQTEDIIAKDKEESNVIKTEPMLEESEDSEGIQVYEQKINKVVYYVSDDNDKRIFQKNKDGEIGDELGFLEMANGKLKPKWNSPLQT